MKKPAKKSPQNRPSSLAPAASENASRSKLWTLVLVMVAAAVVIGFAIAQTGSSAAAGEGAPVYSYEVVNRYPHNPQSFTQGLLYLDGMLYEGTGQRGESAVMKVDLETGEILERQAIPDRYFGEGITAVGDELVELTWQSETGFVYDRETLRPLRQWTYDGEGWGLTTTPDGSHVIMSDGTAFLRFLDPETLEETRRVQVTDNGRPIVYLNEIEYIDGEVWANVWQTNRIARIDPETGQVNSWVDLSGLLPASESQGADVLNGIAYDAEGDRLFVTGKWWPRLFEIRVVER